MPLTPCLDCGAPTRGNRCPAHRKAREHARGSRQERGYTDAWLTAARQAIATHVAAHGPVCPGWQRPPHPVDAAELTGDHHVALAQGGPLLPDRIAVLCKSCNASKGATR